MSTKLPVVRIKYSDDQPREPGGSSEGGQFSSSGSAAGGVGGEDTVGEKLRALGIASITLESGVKKDRAEAVLLHAHEVFNSLSADPLVARALQNGPMNGGGLHLVVGSGKFVTHSDHEGAERRALAFYNKESHTITVASGLSLTNAAARPSVGLDKIGRDFRTVLAHVIGHAVSGKLAIAASAAGADKVGAELFNSRPRDYWRKTVSFYAGTNTREFMAEAFAAYTHPGYAQGKALPKELVSVFEKAGVKAGIRKTYGCTLCTLPVVTLK